MRSKIKVFALAFFALLGLFLVTGSASDSYAQEEEGGDGTVACCVCLSSDCCFIALGDACDPLEEIDDPVFLNNFFAILGIEGSAICDLCNQCAKNVLTPSEDRQFLDICDFCVGEDLFEALQCEIRPAETTAAFVAEGNSSCRLNPDGGTNGGFTWFWIGGILTLLGWRWESDSPRHT
jgi:hypothetical protein